MKKTIVILLTFAIVLSFLSINAFASYYYYYLTNIFFSISMPLILPPPLDLSWEIIYKWIVFKYTLQKMYDYWHFLNAYVLLKVFTALPATKIPSLGRHPFTMQASRANVSSLGNSSWWSRTKKVSKEKPVFQRLTSCPPSK